MRVHASPNLTGGGYWNLYVNNVDYTFFRGLPVTISQLADTDPFGPSTAQFKLQQVSPLEPVGSPGTDLEWLRPDTPIEIVYSLDAEHVHAANMMGFGDKYYWKGFISSFTFTSQNGDTSITVECQGALRVLNNILAMKEQVSNPYPYEHAIKHAVDNAIVRLGAKSGPLKGMSTDISVFEKLDWWPASLKFNDSTWSKKYPNEAWMLPAPGTVENGKKWSGMLTRDMGGNDKTLSSYVDGMLKLMYTERGRFSIRLKYGTWQPELFHQDLIGHTDVDESKVLHVESAWPGVGFQLEQDYSQTVTTIYGNASGTGVDGSNYTGEEFTADGSGTWFKPFADSPGSQSELMRREKFMQFNDGLGVDDAMQVSAEHISRNVEPGYVGSITLTSVDPKVYTVAVDGVVGGEMVPFPHQFIRSGMSIRLHGFGGRKHGVTFFVSECSHDVSGNTVTMTVDTKFRDYVTVQEVRARGRDSMAPIRLMTPGGYSPSAKDRLVPWDGKKSGFMPEASWSIWQTAEGQAGPAFPWQGLTQKYPPRKHPEFYTRIKTKTDFVHGAAGAPLPEEQHSQYWATHIRNGSTKWVKRTRTYDPSSWMDEEYPEMSYFYPPGNPADIDKDYEPEDGDRFMGDPGLDPGVESEGHPGEPETQWLWHKDPDFDKDKPNDNDDSKGEGHITDDKHKYFGWAWFEHNVDNTPTAGKTYPCPIDDKNCPGTTYQVDAEESTDKDWIRRQSSMRLASSGTITAVRMMCVDADGNPLRVTYHLSLYSRWNVPYDAMPKLPGEYPKYFNVNKSTYFPDFEDSKTRYYDAACHYPFYPYAWEERYPDGSRWGPDGGGDELGRVPNDVDLLKAFGSYWERPGTFPWRLQDPSGYRDGMPRWNGLFSWDGEIGFATSVNSEGQAPEPPLAESTLEKILGSFMIYCDDLPLVDKYFIGRVYVDQRGGR